MAKKSLKTGKKFSQTQILIGMVYFSQKKYRLAITAFTDALKNNGAKDMIFKYRGMSYNEIGKHNKALADLEKALKYKSDFDTLFSKADSLYELKKYEKTLDVCNSVLKKDPTEEYFWLLNALSLDKLNKIEESLNSLAIVNSINSKVLLNLKNMEEFKNVKKTKRYKTIMKMAKKSKAL